MYRRSLWTALLGTTTAIGLACGSFDRSPQAPAADAEADSSVAPIDANADDATNNEAGSPNEIVDVAAGETVGCALRASGKVLCWGSNNEGAIGELGGTVDDNCDGNLPCRFTPREVPGIDGVVQIALSGNTVFARRSDGSVWSWGSNNSGLLGTGTINPSSRAGPQRIAGIKDAIDVVSGWSVACARLANGDVACWGQNLYAMLQQPPSFDVKAPEIKSALAGSKKISLSMTGGFGCAISPQDAVRCWGQSLRGSLGYGPDAGTAGDVPCGLSGERCQVTPIAISDLKASSVAAGQHTGCAMTLAGPLLCWGSNIGGELGIDSFDFEAHPTPVVVPLTGSVTKIAGSARHFCAVTGGGLSCWGQNELGEIGNGLLGAACTGGEKCTKTPVEVLTNVARVSAGKGLTVVLTTNGSVYAWGGNKDARLGHRPGDNGDLATCSVYGNARCNGTPQEIVFP